MVYYLSSCTFTSICNRTSEKIRDYLFQRGVNICGCCHYVQQQFQAGDTVLFVCDACSAVTAEHSPQVKLISLYRFLLEDPGFAWPDFGGESITLQDAWSLRHDQDTQEAVRTCLERMNFRIVELPENRENTQFEGAARYRRRSARKLRFAPVCMGEIDRQTLPEPEDGIEAEMKRNAARYTTSRVVAYTNNTLTGLRMGGVRAVHLLDLIARDLD